MLSLPDLVQAKKTQRDKDWPMIRRLVEAHYFEHHAKPRTAQIKFWLRELRTPQLLLKVAQAYTSLALRLAAKRPLLRHAVTGTLAQLETKLSVEENKLRTEDRAVLAAVAERTGKLEASGMKLGEPPDDRQPIDAKQFASASFEE